mgnify:CR=1 FL=1
MNAKLPFMQGALALLAGLSVANAAAQTSPWFAFVDAASQDGGSPADRATLLGTGGFGAISGEYSEQHSLIGSIGVGRELANGLFVTLSGGSSTNMKSRFGANTKPIGAPAYLTATSSGKRDSALLMLGYRFFESDKFSAYAAAGVEYSRSKIDTEYVSSFIYPTAPYYRTRRDTETTGAFELGARYALTPTFAIGPFARLHDGERSAFGVRLSAKF